MQWELGIRPFKILKHLKSLLTDQILNGPVFQGLSYGYAPNHLKYDIFARFQIFFKGATCADFKASGFQISDPIRNQDH